MKDTALLTPAPVEEKFFGPTRKRFQPPVLERSPALVLNAHGEIETLTPLARRLLDFGPNQRIQPSFFSHLSGKNLNQVMCDLADMVCGRKPRAQWLLRLRTGRGRWRWFQAVARPLPEDTTPEAGLPVSEDGAILVTLTEV